MYTSKEDRLCSCSERLVFDIINNITDKEQEEYVNDIYKPLIKHCSGSFRSAKGTKPLHPKKSVVYVHFLCNILCLSIHVLTIYCAVIATN